MHHPSKTDREVIFLGPLLPGTSAACPLLSRSVAEIHAPVNPFGAASIWNRTIASIGANGEAAWANVNSAIWGDASFTPTSATPDIVTICYSDSTQSSVNIERSNGWSYPFRSQSSGGVLYKRNLNITACGCVSWNPIGNALFVIIDSATQKADVGVGGWRLAGGPLLQVPADGSAAHNIDISSAGSGIYGSARASSLPPLGGLIRPGELVGGIPHAVAIAMPGARFHYGISGRLRLPMDPRHLFTLEQTPIIK